MPLCNSLQYGRGPVTSGFDHLGAAMLSMFQVATLNDWDSLFYRTSDNIGWYSGFIFIPYLFLINYFVLNVFIAVLSNHLTKNPEIYTGVGLEKQNFLKRQGFRVRAGSDARRGSEPGAPIPPWQVHPPLPEGCRQASDRDEERGGQLPGCRVHR